MGDVWFAREGLLDCRAELEPLLAAHWREIAHYQDIPLDVDWDGYAATEATGAIRCYTVRHDGLLCGYAVFVVRRNAHYKGSLQAHQDVLFLIPEMRRSTTGMRFVAWCEEQLRTDGVQVAYHHVKAAHPALGAVLKRQGYELVDSIFAKRLDL